MEFIPSYLVGNFKVLEHKTYLYYIWACKKASILNGEMKLLDLRKCIYIYYVLEKAVACLLSS
jgi:hypothetical protein